MSLTPFQPPDNYSPSVDDICAKYDDLIASLQVQLAEKGKTILEMQELFDDIIKTAEKAKDTPNVYAWEIGLGNVIALASQINLSAIESALKAERLAGKIEGLEEAARLKWITYQDNYAIEVKQAYRDRLYRMVVELKEGKC